jgi:hypothetical protein
VSYSHIRTVIYFINAIHQSLVQDAGNTALTQPPVHIYTSTSPELRSRYGRSSIGPSLIALKVDSKGEFQPTASLSIGKDKSGNRVSHKQIHDFLARNAIPLVTELGSSNFQTIMNANAYDTKPLVVIMASKLEEMSNAKKMLAAGEEGWRREKEEQEREHGPLRDVLWVYIDGEKWSSWLKSMYGIKESHLPAYVVADHSVRVRYHTVLIVF